MASDGAGEGRIAGVALWRSAIDFAARAHAGHTRRDGRTPYVAHVVRVAMIVREVFGCDDPETIAAAYLHDTIEDTPTDRDDIERRFGAVVAGAVAALTKNMILPEAEREPEYDARLAAADWRARLVKLADVYDNGLDTLAESESGKRRTKMVAKIDRALTLAEADLTGEHAETMSRAIDVVRSLRAKLNA